MPDLLIRMHEGSDPAGLAWSTGLQGRRQQYGELPKNLAFEVSRRRCDLEQGN